MWSQMMTQRSIQSSRWWLILLEGIAALMIGFCLLVSPAITLSVLMQFLGFYWLFCGVLSLVSLFMDRTVWVWKLLAGGLGILAGLGMIRYSFWSAVFVSTSLAVALGVLGVILGIDRCIEAFRGVGIGSFILGFVSIILGFILLFSPVMTAIALVIMAGVIAFLGGLASIIIAFRMKTRTFSAV